MLSEINEKVNILTLTDNTELVNEIKETLNELNSLPSTADANNEIQSTLNQINVKLISLLRLQIQLMKIKNL